MPKERRKIEKVHQKIRNIVLASALQDFINTKKAFVYHATKTVRLARELIVLTVKLALVV